MTILQHNRQLSLDFNTTFITKPENKGNFSYHPTGSTILKDEFSIKLTFNSRSYLLKGKYRIATIKVFGNTEDKSKMLGFVELNKILGYRGFIYSPAFITKTERLKLTKAVEKILSNPEYNENLIN